MFTLLSGWPSNLWLLLHGEAGGLGGGLWVWLGIEEGICIVMLHCESHTVHINYEMIVILVFDEIFCFICNFPFLNLSLKSRCLAVGHMTIMLNRKYEEDYLLSYSISILPVVCWKHILRAEPQYRPWHSLFVIEWLVTWTVGVRLLQLRTFQL